MCTQPYYLAGESTKNFQKVYLCHHFLKKMPFCDGEH